MSNESKTSAKSIVESSKQVVLNPYDAWAEIQRLRAGLQLIAIDEHRLMNVTARQTAQSILDGKPIHADEPKRYLAMAAHMRFRAEAIGMVTSAASYIIGNPEARKILTDWLERVDTRMILAGAAVEPAAVHPNADTPIQRLQVCESGEPK